MKAFQIYILALALTVSVAILSFADHNGNGIMDAGESYVPGVYRLHRIAADGAVSLVVVRYPPGVPYVLELEPGDRVTAISGCGEWPVAGEVVHVPVVCGAVFAPMILGAQ